MLNTVKTRLAITRKNLQIERKQMNLGAEYLNTCSTVQEVLWPSSYLHLIICLENVKVISSSQDCPVGGGKEDQVN